MCNGTHEVKRAYWFGGDVLPHGDGRPVAVGVTHTVEPPIVPCERGLHASVHPADALTYAKCATLWLVELGGTIAEESDKLAASERTYLACIDATKILHTYARWCASQVLHLWDAPDVVREYLATGDESIRHAARDAARDARSALTISWAARAAHPAWTVAWNASWASRAAENAAGDAWGDTGFVWSALNAAGNTAWAAKNAAGDGGWITAKDAQRAHLLGLVEAAFRDQGVK